MWMSRSGWVLVSMVLGCGGAQTTSSADPPLPEVPLEEAPPPVLVSESFQHDALGIPLLGTLDPTTRIVVGEQTIAGAADGTFELSGGEFSAPVPARWVENLISSLRPPLLGFECPEPRGGGRRAGLAVRLAPTYVITSGGTTSTYVEGCIPRRVDPESFSLAADDVVARFNRVAITAARLELVRRDAVGKPIPDANFEITTPEGMAPSRRIAMHDGHFELCTPSEGDSSTDGSSCFALSDIFVAALASILREASCTGPTLDERCPVLGDVGAMLEHAVEWSPDVDLTGVGTEP